MKQLIKKGNTSMADSHRKPRMSLTEEQKLQALRLVKKMLAMGSYPSDIKTAIAGKYHLSRRSVERYMTRARREMDEHMEEDILQHRAEAYYFYRNITANEKLPVRERLHARERIDKLFGLDIHRHEKENRNAQQVQNMPDE